MIRSPFSILFMRNNDPLHPFSVLETITCSATMSTHRTLSLSLGIYQVYCTAFCSFCLILFCIVFTPCLHSTHFCGLGSKQMCPTVWHLGQKWGTHSGKYVWLNTLLSSSSTSTSLGNDFNTSSSTKILAYWTLDWLAVGA